jgi:EAL domain-containing protein (putative c-di-GMP-specific phosphodiesterase class I)
LEQFAVLQAMGCELAQGYLFGPARPASELSTTLAMTSGVVHGTDVGIAPD